MSDLYRQWRKAELHLHLEGSVEPETACELDPTLTVDSVREQYAFADFQGFIRSYIWINRLLRSPADYALATRRLLDRLAGENVTYAEINLSVGVMLWKEQEVRPIFEAIAAAATSQSAVEVRWIFDAVRHFGFDHVMAVARLAVEHSEDGVVAFGIGGDEQRGPAELFGRVFDFVRGHGLAVVPHAGEIAGPESVWAALRAGAVRIGHGIRSVEDPRLLDHLREHDIPLEVCPTSNVCTGAVRSLEDHPLRRLYEAGVPIILGSDDPAIFRTTLTHEFEVAASRFGFSTPELEGIAANGFRYRLPRA